jgi:predicted PurR-regulated permease PerM
MNQKLEISLETIFKFFFIAACFYLLYLVRRIFVWFLFAIIISVLIEPLVDFLRKKKIPKLISVISVYFSIFSLISLFIYFTALPLVSEIRQFIQILPQYFEKISPPLKTLGFEAFENIESFMEMVSKNLERVAETIFNAMAAIFGGFLATLSIFSFSIFLSLEEKPIERVLSFISPKEKENFFLETWSRCRDRISGWFLSRILACLFVGILFFISLLILKTKYPFSLGLLAGFLNFVPIVGPAITGIAIFLVVFFESPFKAFLALVSFILIQQIENNIVTPALAKKFVGLSPVMVLFSLAIGGTLWGFWGAILAIPLFGILFEFSKEYLEKGKEKAEIL